MHPENLSALHKRNAGTCGRHHLTGMKNIADMADSPPSSPPSSSSATAQTVSHAALLQGLMHEAKTGGEDFVAEAAIDRLRGAGIAADQLANLQNILATLGGQQNNTYEYDHWERERQRHMTHLIDINGRPNYSDEPVYYRPHATFTKAVAGIPYQVSDIIYTCHRCTYKTKCERHRTPEWTKTSVSLCNESHTRMTLSWDINDVENRKGTWRFDIESKFDRFANPDEERHDHERALADNKPSGCCAVDPVVKIRDLAKRVIEDHNDEMMALARREILDPKGREYFTKAQRWGGKDPFKPSAKAQVRAAHSYAPFEIDSSRVERELRVMLQAWHKSKVAPELKMRDRTAANMKAAWAAKMEDEKAARAAKKAVEELNAAALGPVVRQKKMHKEPEGRYKMSTWDKRVLDAEKTKPAERAASRELTAEERKLLKSMSKAGEAEAKEQAEEEPRQQSTPSDSEDRPVVKKVVKAKQTLATTKASKRKATSEVDDASSSRKKFKSADVIDDSDDEADYQLPSTPTTQLPEQREGWVLTQAPTTTVPVAQTDNADAFETPLVVEQGTTIVKELEAEPVTPRAYASPAPSLPSTPTPTSPHTPPPSSPSKKRKFSFADLADSTSSSPPAKKAKKVSFTAELLSPVSAPRKLSMVYARSSSSSSSVDDEANEECEVDDEDEEVKEVLAMIEADFVSAQVESESEDEDVGYDSDTEEE